MHFIFDVETVKRLEAKVASLEETNEKLMKLMLEMSEDLRELSNGKEGSEYVKRAVALEIFPFSKTKLKEYSKKKFANGEPVIRTQSPNGAGRSGKVYYVPDLKNAGHRHQRWLKEQQTGEYSENGKTGSYE